MKVNQFVCSLVMLLIFLTPVITSASVVGPVSDAMCSVELQLVDELNYEIVSVNKVLPKGILYDCEALYVELTGMSVGNTISVSSALELETAPARFVVPFTSVSTMGEAGAVMGIHYYFEVLTMESNKINVETPTAADDTPPTTFKDSTLYSWWYQLTAWLGLRN